MKNIPANVQAYLDTLIKCLPYQLVAGDCLNVGTDAFVMKVVSTVAKGPAGTAEITFTDGTTGLVCAATDVYVLGTGGVLS